MDLLDPFLAPPVRPRLLLGLTLSEHCDDLTRMAFRTRLRSYLVGSNVRVVGLGARLELHSAAFSPLERVWLIAWLVRQPEVVLLHFARSRRGATTGGRHGRD